MRKTRRFGLPALSALLLVGALASCSQSDKAGILLKVDTDTTVPKSPAITSLAVTANGTTQTFDVSKGLPGTLGIETSPGDKDVVVVGLTADNTPVAKGTATCPATAGKVLECSVKLSVLPADAGIPADASPSDTGGAPGFDGGTSNDAPTSTGGASGGSGGVVTSGGTTTTGGVTTAGGTLSTGGATGGAPDAGGGATGFDAGSNIDAPPSTAGGSGGTAGATTAGGTMSSGGATSSSGATSSGGATSSAGVTTSGGLSNSGGGGATGTGGASTTGGSKPTGGTTSTGGATSTGGTTKLVATAVAAGYGHSCALLKDGTVWCWGNNTSGELGNEDPSIDGSTIVIKTTPVQAKIASQAVSLATGAYHTCVVLTDSTVQCFGENSTGQIGNGDAGNYALSTTPASVRNADNGLLSNVASVVAGSGHTCALLSDKTVKCWGYNYDGQLGNGNNSSSTTPVQVLTSSSPSTPLTNVLVLALTHDHTCAIRSGNSVDCWGDNGYGELGNGNADPTTVAVQAKNITATAVAAGGTHSCVVTATTVSPFNVQCWGSDFYGQLGDNAASTGYLPVHAQVLRNASSISLGRTHTCAVMVDSTVECWGDNEYGQLGNASITENDVPVSVSLSQQAASLGAGEFHTCAVINGGAVYCWGDNYYGQMGNGTGGPNQKSTLPVLVSGF